MTTSQTISAADYKRLKNAPSGATKSKYGVRLDAKGKAARTVDGILFASKHEALRYINLKLLVRAGEITALRRQVPFSLTVPIHNTNSAVVAIGTYFADFQYRDKGGALVTEDCKGCITDVYALKKKMVEATYGIKILET